MRVHSALVDSSTFAVLAVSSHVSAIVFVNECMQDTVHIPYAQFPNYRESLPIAACAAEEFPEWTWEAKTRTFIPTRPSVVTDALRARARLAGAKLGTISIIINELSIARYKVRTGVDFQETTYLTKKLEAQRFKDSGYDENRAIEFPYVLQYADFAGLSLKDAADKILLAAKFDDQLLAKTELLRLRYFNKVKEESDPERFAGIREEFLRDCYVNARV